MSCQLILKDIVILHFVPAPFCDFLEAKSGTTKEAKKYNSAVALEDRIDIAETCNDVGASLSGLPDFGSTKKSLKVVELPFDLSSLAFWQHERKGALVIVKHFQNEIRIPFGIEM